MMTRSGGHVHALFHHGHSVVHRTAAEAKLAAAFISVLAVAITPAGARWAFALFAGVAFLVTVIARLRFTHVLSRLLIVTPFLLLAASVPFVSSGEQIAQWGPLTVSREGLTAGIAIAAKSLLGAWASIIIAATTEPAQIARGMRFLRAPQTLVTIALFMLRYLDVLAEEVSRQRLAMTSRAHDPRWLSQARPMASGAGVLFVRSYERGERVHAAMMSRGFAGTFPTHDAPSTSRAQWMGAAAIALACVAITIGVRL